MRVVIALGGNALLQRGEPLDAQTQRTNVNRCSQAIAAIAAKHNVVITHGNGPQIGLLALQGAACADVKPYPLDILGAETVGMIGYMLDQELVNVLPQRDVATLLTQTLVDPDDPAFKVPTKFVGPVYEEREAWRLAAARGWTVARDGDYYRRVVPSPMPKAILELSTIELLLDSGIVVVCTGGGGVPVIKDESGMIHGVEAVVDKDHASALLAQRLKADALLLLTDVNAVYVNWGLPEARAIRSASPAHLSEHVFAAGSMGPKVEAACDFARATGGFAAIGALEDAETILERKAGTVIGSAISYSQWDDTEAA